MNCWPEEEGGGMMNVNIEVSIIACYNDLLTSVWPLSGPQSRINMGILYLGAKM